MDRKFPGGTDVNKSCPAPNWGGAGAGACPPRAFARREALRGRFFWAAPSPANKVFRGLLGTRSPASSAISGTLKAAGCVRAGRRAQAALMDRRLRQPCQVLMAQGDQWMFYMGETRALLGEAGGSGHSQLQQLQGSEWRFVSYWHSPPLEMTFSDETVCDVSSSGRRLCRDFGERTSECSIPRTRLHWIIHINHMHPFAN
ncbi:unnamed protein product [Lepidochelys kempii]